MQFLLNLAYNALSSIFSTLDSVAFPDWFSDIVTGLTYYIEVLNYFIPLETYFTVTLSVLAIVLILMIVSAILQIL